MNKFEENLERTYQTWENLLQGIRNTSDCEQFQRTLFQNEDFFTTEFNNKKQILTKNKSEIDKEIIENTERLEDLKKQHFAANSTKQLTILQQTQKLQLIKIRRRNTMQAKIKLETIQDKFCQKLNETDRRLRNMFIILDQQQNDDQPQGLTSETIQTFHLFTADESHVGDQCSICMGDIDVGRRMMRLTCEGQHSFCQECIEGWFAEHNTCPICRHKFE